MQKIGVCIFSAGGGLACRTAWMNSSCDGAGEIPGYQSNQNLEVNMMEWPLQWKTIYTYMSSGGSMLLVVMGNLLYFYGVS